jgi:beta-glucosidase
MRAIGLHAYRFSIAWPRIFPNGTGAVNQAGLDFYDRLVDKLLEADIKPFATLYHWDLPQALQEQGGWERRETAEAFAAYADVLARRLGDRVQYWMTHNEPWCTAFLGNWMGVHAPGIQNGAALTVAHHVLLSHGMAAPLIRAASPNAQVGIALNFSPAYPASDSPEDQAAARRHDGFFNRWFMDPLYGRGYPADMLELYTQMGMSVPVQPGDLETIAAPLDFLGVNYYNRAVIEAAPGEGFGYRSINPPGEYTDMEWEVYPDALRALLVRLHKEWGARHLYITENGAAYPDVLEGDAVHDPKRVRFLEQHFAAALQAIREGAPLKGFFIWSLMDNFEWALGYTKRFGITYVDYATQRRILKDSAKYVRQVIVRNGL